MSNSDDLSFGRIGPELKITSILMDVDGTMTRIRPGGRVPVGSDVRLAELLARKRNISVEQALRLIHSQKDLDQNCIFFWAQKFGIEEEQLWKVMLEDWKGYIDLPDDLGFFLKEMKKRGIPIYSATTNSRRMTLLKMAVGGLAEFDETPYLAGFYSGNYFHDPRGKFAPDYFPKILKAGQFDPNKTLMIGDEYGHDCAPSLAAGIRWAVLIDRDSRQPLEANENGLIRINSLRHIVPCISSGR